ncbi:MAG: hypothetical protein ISR65_18705 [Bacteriovoracaceae bacterium]|nr:hypothetical protein [Bacteriovoracaceae bacterium]
MKKHKLLLCLLLLFSLQIFANSSKHCAKDLHALAKARRMGGHLDYLDFSQLHISNHIGNDRYDAHRIVAVRLQTGVYYKLGKKLGYGRYGVVYCIEVGCKLALKIPKSGYRVHSFIEEVKNGPLLKRAGITSAHILDHGYNYAYLIKEYVPGKTAKELLTEGRYTDQQIRELATIYKKAKTHQLSLDVNPANFVWSEEVQTFILVDNFFRGRELGFGDKRLQWWQNELFYHNQDQAQRFAELIKEG